MPTHLLPPLPLAHAVERSRHGGHTATEPVEAAPGDKAAGPVPMATSDPITQLLLAVYFFLVGVAVSTARLLWVIPLASAASALVFLAADRLSRALLPFYRWV